MAPEQVDGKPADERTDVFLLGATLYHLLTGQAPFAKSRSFQQPRQVKPWIPAALEAICCKATAQEPQARYACAEELAADVERWLADEPVRVYREPLGQQLARWLRRHRTLAGIAAVVLLVLVPLAVGFSLLVAAKNQELTQTNRDLELALVREEEQRQQAEQARQLAELRRQQAERAAERARSVIELVASDEAFDQLSRKKELSAEEKKLLEALVPYYGEYAGESGSRQAEQQRQARAYYQLGRTLQLLGQHGPAEKGYRQAWPLYERLVAEHPQVPAYRQELARTHNNLGPLLQTTGRADEAEKAFRQALPLYERLVAEHPQVPTYRQQLASTHNNLGVLLKDTGRADEAEKAFRQALQLFERLVAEHPQVPQYKVEFAKTLAGLGILYGIQGKTEEALPQLERARKILGEVVQKHPEEAEA